MRKNGRFSPEPLEDLKISQVPGDISNTQMTEEELPPVSFLQPEFWNSQQNNDEKANIENNREKAKPKEKLSVFSSSTDSSSFKDASDKNNIDEESDTEEFPPVPWLQKKLTDCNPKAQ